MDSDSWPPLPAASKLRHSRYDLYLGFEEIDGGGDEESRAEYPCPFCPEDFDILELCCHIDEEHPIEAINGVCPVCQVRFGTDLVAHMTMEHENFFKMQRRRKHRKGSSGSHSTISFLRKELREGNLQSLLGGSSHAAAPFSAAPDPLLSSFINLHVADSSRDAQPESVNEGSMVNKISDENDVERMEASVSEKDHEERAGRCEFVRGLITSTIFEDEL